MHGQNDFANNIFQGGFLIWNFTSKFVLFVIINRCFGLFESVLKVFKNF